MQIIFTYQPIALVEQSGIVKVLVISIVFFLALLILGIRKSYKLKAENDKLLKTSDDLLKEEEEVYKDFTEGHMYQSNTSQDQNEKVNETN